MFLFETTVKKKQEFTHHSIEFFSRTQLGGLLSLREIDRKALEALRNIFQESFISNSEKTTVNKDGKHEKTPAEVRLEIFELQEGKKQLKLGEEELNRMMRYSRQPVSTGLESDSESMIKYIHDFINSRRKSKLHASYERINSAPHLFCIELIAWLNDLATHPQNEITLNGIKTRIKYLDKVLRNNVFKSEPAGEHQIHKLIYKVLDDLSLKVVSKIIWKINQESSRDHFNDLMNHAELYMKHIINGLFYLFSSIEYKKAQTFDIYSYNSIINDRTSPLYDYFDNTYFGKVLPLLCNVTNAFSQKQYSPEQDTSVSLNFFITERGEVNPDQYKKLSALMTGSNKHVSSGIHSIFADNEIIKDFLLTLGYLNDFAVFLQAFRQMYKLAGHGGNIYTLYALSQETTNLSFGFMHIMAKLKTHLAKILSLNETHNREYTLSGNEQDWLQKSNIFNDNYELAEQELDHCGKKIHDLLGLLKYVNTPAYQERVRRETKEFQDIMKVINIMMQRSCNLPTTQPMVADSKQEVTTPQTVTPLLKKPNAASNIFLWSPENENTDAQADINVQEKAIALIETYR